MNLSAATAVYAGTTAAQALYYGAKKLWPFSGWRQVGDTLLPSRPTNTFKNESFGVSVSLNSAATTLAVGQGNFSINNPSTGFFEQIGRAVIYARTGATWTPTEISHPIAYDPYGSVQINPANTFGKVTVLNHAGDVLAISGPADRLPGSPTEAGATYIFFNDGGSWVSQHNISGESLYEYSGSSLALDASGNVLAIGAPEFYVSSHLSNKLGKVRVFYRSAESVIQLGQTMLGLSHDERFGHSLALASPPGGEVGARLIVGIPHGSTSFPGTAKVYEFDGMEWAQVGQTLTGAGNGDKFGESVAISQYGDVCAIGAPNNDLGANNRGSVTVYEYNGTSWAQKGPTILGEAASDNSGASISMSADGLTLAIGARNNDGKGSNAGHVRVYFWNGSDWQKRGDDIDGIAAGDASGTAVALSADGSTLVTGAPLNDTQNTNAGHARVFEYIA
jgi:hypothetical protein